MIDKDVILLVIGGAIGLASSLITLVVTSIVEHKLALRRDRINWEREQAQKERERELDLLQARNNEMRSRIARWGGEDVLVDPSEVGQARHKIPRPRMLPGSGDTSTLIQLPVPAHKAVWRPTRQRQSPLQLLEKPLGQLVFALVFLLATVVSTVLLNSLLGT